MENVLLNGVKLLMVTPKFKETGYNLTETRFPVDFEGRKCVQTPDDLFLNLSFSTVAPFLCIVNASKTSGESVLVGESLIEELLHF
jgi:hypothetical protein